MAVYGHRIDYENVHILRAHFQVEQGFDDVVLNGIGLLRRFGVFIDVGMVIRTLKGTFRTNERGFTSQALPEGLLC